MRRPKQKSEILTETHMKKKLEEVERKREIIKRKKGKKTKTTNLARIKKK